MAAKSSPSETIQRIATIVHGRLKPLEYRKIGKTLYLLEGDIYRCLAFRGSKWNRQDQFSFTIDATITTPLVHWALSGGKFPANPASAESVLSERIGFLRPDPHDFWWEVNSSVNLQSIIEDVRESILDHAIPFLDRYRTFESLLNRLGQPGGLPWGTEFSRRLILAILLWKSGKETDAMATFAELVREAKFEEARERVLSVEARLREQISTH